MIAVVLTPPSFGVTPYAEIENQQDGVFCYFVTDYPQNFINLTILVTAHGFMNQELMKVLGGQLISGPHSGSR